MIHAGVTLHRLVKTRSHIAYGSLRLRQFNQLSPQIVRTHDMGKMSHLPDTAEFRKSASILPSLALFISNRCGISLAEIQTLAGEGRLRIEGGPEISAKLLKSRRAYNAFSTQSEKFQLRNEAGQWVPAALRSAHRCYILYNRPVDVSPIPEIGNPQSWVHQIPAQDSSTLYAPFPVELIRYPHTSGLTIITSDLHWQRYLSVEHAGIGSRVLFRCLPGCPREVATQVASNMREAYRPVDGAEFTFRHVSNAFDASLLGTLDGNRLEGDVGRHPMPAQFAFTVDGTYFPSAGHHLAHRALQQIDQITMLSREGVELHCTGLAVGEYRYMTAAEVEHFERAILRIKAHLVCGHLRNA